MTRAAVVAASLVIAAGCGGGSDSDEPPAPEAVELAKRCGVAPPEGGDPPAGLVPPNLLPEGAVVTRWQGDERATLLLRGSINESFKALLATAQQSGREIVFREVEVFDAEIDVRLPDGVVRFALQPAPTCDDFTRAVVSKRRA
jgi:hypothetical protein